MKLKKNVFLLLGVSLAVWGGSGYADDKKSTAKLRVGQVHQGGVIVYLDGSHGLIAAPEEQSAGIPWVSEHYEAFIGNIPNPSGAKGTAIGTGKTNTTLIVGVMGDGNYAAKLCRDLNLNGYKDWFLPSKDELNMLYKNKRRFQDGVFAFYGYDTNPSSEIYKKVDKALGGHSGGIYWSSSDAATVEIEGISPWVWKQDFGGGKGHQSADANGVFNAPQSPDVYGEYVGVRVRCFRAF